jgi:BirA family transcriptional regulator, biotin operon repressor / biotin---[acetyl-CoA-carboxylase] ligase
VGQGPYTDLERPPLREEALRRALLVPGGLWTDVRVVAETGSTNADVAAAAREGAPEGLVLVAERQTAGRGRLGRAWVSPPRAGITMSILLRPTGIDPARFGWLPLLAGVAMAETVRRIADVDASLKWPNDLLVGERKCAGILAEAVPAAGAEAVPATGVSTKPGVPEAPSASRSAVVIGIGLNTTLREHELPHPDTTSLALVGASCVDRDPLLRALLRSFAIWYARWRDAAGDADVSGLREAYAFHSATLGRDVLVHLPGGAELRGRAESVDSDGRLVVDGLPLAAGDVVHLR